MIFSYFLLAALSAGPARAAAAPLLLDGLRKACDGRTPLAEILRVIDSAD